MADIELPDGQLIPRQMWRKYIYINTYYFRSAIAYLVMAQLVCSFIGFILLAVVGNDGDQSFMLSNGLVALFVTFATYFTCSCVMFFTSIVTHPNSHNIIKTTFFPLYHFIGSLTFLGVGINILADDFYHNRQSEVFAAALAMLNCVWFFVSFVLGLRTLVMG